MDELSMVIFLICLGVFNFLALLSFSMNKKFKGKYKSIVVSSVFYIISKVLFYFDVKYILESSTLVLISFFTFLFLLLSISLYIRSFVKLIGIETRITIWMHIVYAIVMSGFLALGSYQSNLVLRFIGFYLGIEILLLIGLNYIRKSKKVKFINISSILMISVFVVMVVNVYHYFTFEGEILLSSPPMFFKFYILLVNMIIIILIFSFIIEISKQLMKDLEYKSILLENMFDKAKYISETDELTQCYNRRKMNELLEVLQSNYIEHHIPFSICLIDIDSFKDINDVYGHNVGDNVLKYFVSVLERIVRESDFVGRWGGDEFIVLLTNTSYENSLKVASNIRNYTKIYKDGKIEIPINASIGCAQITEEEISSIIHKADEELYKEKKIKNKSAR